MKSDPNAQNFDCVFRPASVALTGVAPSPNNWGSHIWPGVLLDLGFHGDLYPVSSRASEVCGLKALARLSPVVTVVTSMRQISYSTWLMIQIPI